MFKYIFIFCWGVLFTKYEVKHLGSAKTIFNFQSDSNM